MGNKFHQIIIMQAFTLSFLVVNCVTNDHLQIHYITNKFE